MTETPLANQGPYARGAFRYGMLLLIVALWCVTWWSWLTRTPPRDRSGPAMNVVVASMLLVNHAIASFLSVERQRRVRVVQFIFIGAGALFVFRTALSN